MPRLAPCVAFAAVVACSGARQVERQTPGPAAVSRYAEAHGARGAARVAFTLSPAADDFFARPWPTELARAGDRLDLSSFPGKDAPIFDEYVRTAARDLDGFSLAPVVYFHFEGSVDASWFAIEPKATMSASSFVFLVDVDPASPERGARTPLEMRYYDEDFRYVPHGVLAVKPLHGFVLRPNTLYAAVVRRAGRLGTTDDLEHLKWTIPRAAPAEERARALHAPSLDALERMDVPRAEIAAIALFRTAAPHALDARMVAAVEALPADRAPRVLDAAWDDAAARTQGDGGYAVVRGHYCTPNFQTDAQNAPFLSSPGGAIQTKDGAPIPVPLPDARDGCGGMIRARFVLSIPRRPMPALGFPLLVTAHGTGGDASSFLGVDDFAGWAAREGIAAISTDQPLHGGALGGRPGANAPARLHVAGFDVPLGQNVVEVAFYNPLYPAAARGNLQQATLDAVVLVHLFGGLDFAKVPSFVAREGLPPPRLDGARILAAGHSQGSQSVIALGAIEPRVKGVVLSGCGGDARIGILTRADVQALPLVRMILGVDAAELDRFHPFFALLQNLVDPVDPQTYARFYWDPLPGHRPQNVLHFEGVRDTYTPPITAEALAVSLHATPIEPVVSRVDAFDLLGIKPAARARGDVATRAFLQYESTRRENGHFVLYHEPGASAYLRQLLRTSLAGPAEMGPP